MNISRSVRGPQSLARHVVHRSLGGEEQGQVLLLGLIVSSETDTDSRPVTILG
jgi:hypothetical protein